MEMIKSMCYFVRKIQEIVCMTIWVPDLPKSNKPTYLAIADAIGEAVRLGQLRPGDALPTHRLLADLMGVNVSTITRAYREAARRRLVGGKWAGAPYVLGVASEAALFALQHRPEGGVIDLSLNMPPMPARDRDLAAALGRLDPTQAARYLHYPSPDEVLVHRQAAAGWLKRRGVEADPESIVVCAGAQHAMDTALGLFPEQEEVACEALVYPGLKAAARHWRRRLHPLAMDGEGLLPEALGSGLPERPAPGGGLAHPAQPHHRHHGPGPAPAGSWTSPGSGTSPWWRRMSTACSRRTRLPPLVSLAPERVLYLTGLVQDGRPGPAHRLPGAAAQRLRDRLRDDEHHTTWYVSALTMALATRWLNDGTAWRRLLAQRRELAARHRLCQEHLQGFRWRGEPHCPHVWLAVAARRLRGLRQAGPGRRGRGGALQRPGGGTPGALDGVRISIGSAPDRRTLAEGLARLAAALVETMIDAGPDEKSPRVSAGALDFNVAATYFSTCVPGSIIGPLELNCRVRDGNGCDLQGIATTKGAKTKGEARRNLKLLCRGMSLIDEKSSRWTN